MNSETFNLIIEEHVNKPLSYAEVECINCGRLRVEKYADGNLICEKCHFNQITKAYDYDDMKYL